MLLGYTFLLISYILCQVAIYSMFYRITGRHDIRYVTGYTLCLGVLRVLTPVGIAWALEYDSTDIMVIGIIKYSLAIGSVVLGKRMIAPH